MADLGAVVAGILDARNTIPVEHAVLVAITGIDGCGKGYVTAHIEQSLRDLGVSTALINIDGWLNLPPRRFSSTAPAENFYRNAIRFEELFAQLVLPLRERRSIRLIADFAEETAEEYRPHLYEFQNVDVVLLEGIYLLKREFQGHYDISIWIDCCFDTALERAISRGQEGLPPAETIAAYRTIYFPAQEIHFHRDDPQAAATIIIENDDRLSSGQSEAGASSTQADFDVRRRTLLFPGPVRLP